MQDYSQKNTKDAGYSDIGMTPLYIYEQLNREFKFDLDPATENSNPLGTKHFFTEETDGLAQVGEGNVFCNPPYSTIKDGVKKAAEEHLRDPKRFIVLLIPARTDTRYFHDYIAPYAEVRFYKGRIKFSGKLSAPFPSMAVIFGGPKNITVIEQEKPEND